MSRGTHGFGLMNQARQTDGVVIPAHSHWLLPRVARGHVVGQVVLRRQRHTTQEQEEIAQLSLHNVVKEADCRTLAHVGNRELIKTFGVPPRIGLRRTCCELRAVVEHVLCRRELASLRPLGVDVSQQGHTLR